MFAVEKRYNLSFMANERHPNIIVHVCTCLYMYVHVCTCMYMLVDVCTCLYMFVMFVLDQALFKITLGRE